MRLTISSIPPNFSPLDGESCPPERESSGLYIACKAAKLIGGAFVGLTSARGDAPGARAEDEAVGESGPADKLAAERVLGEGRIFQTSLNWPAIESSSAVRASTLFCSDLVEAPEEDVEERAACAAWRLAERDSFRNDRSETCSDRFCQDISY